MSYHEAEQFDLPLSKTEPEYRTCRTCQTCLPKDRKEGICVRCAEKQKPQPNRAEVIARAKAAQQRCQNGVMGYGSELYERANDLAAACYGALGALIAELERESK